MKELVCLNAIKCLKNAKLVSKLILWRQLCVTVPNFRFKYFYSVLNVSNMFHIFKFVSIVSIVPNYREETAPRDDKAGA